MGQASRGACRRPGDGAEPSRQGGRGAPRLGAARGRALRSCQCWQAGPVTDNPAPSTRQPLTFKSEDKVCERDYSGICLYKCKPHLTKDERPPDNCTWRQRSSRALHTDVLPGAEALVLRLCPQAGRPFPTSHCPLGLIPAAPTSQVRRQPVEVRPLAEGHTGDELGWDLNSDLSDPNPSS